MYIELVETYYTSDGEQRTRRGRFLVLLQSKDRKLGPENFRAVVRKVALRQLGHWMMGTTRIAGESISLSGSYGNDGLPATVSEKVFLKGIDVPRELYDAWSKGEGWNSAGNEAEAMRKWALETFKEKS